MSAEQFEKSEQEISFFVSAELAGGTSKKETLKSICLLATKLFDGSADEVTRRTLAREEKGNTALIGGIAVPHLLGASRRAHIMLIKLERPVSDWLSLDGVPIDMLVCMAVPELPESDPEGLAKLRKTFVALADDDLANRLSQTVNAGDAKHLLERATGVR